ncbi:hypothetical protein [Telluria aromaticivorans]|uniref:Uncharacterized protein n=1 Tax=Telluria aromaticivorans TaxID=2725995 RepID=A0A7Y2K1G9_9BURK|nr:hypothetical protein [Telluria aromaticivorans]NNG24363.1 hypothetical protein [Telluria aromaticivorans]
MKPLLLILILLGAVPALAHPGHGAPPDHAWFEHAAVAAVVVATGAVLLWGGLRRRRGVLPLAIAVALAVGAGSAGVTLPL